MCTRPAPKRRVWKLAYPTPFRDAVTEVAKASANTMGLMQLTLPTAKRMAKKEEGPITPAALRGVR